MCNDKPSLHIIYGETISQLSAFCLYIESQNIILDNKIINSNEKSFLINLNIDVIDKYDKQLQTDIEIIDNKNKKKILQDDFQNKFKNILLVLLKCIYFFVNKGVKCDDEILNNICKIVVNQIKLQKKKKTHEINEYNYNNELIKNKLNLNTLLDKSPNFDCLRNLV